MDVEPGPSPLNPDPSDEAELGAAETSSGSPRNSILCKTAIQLGAVSLRPSSSALRPFGGPGSLAEAAKVCGSGHCAIISDRTHQDDTYLHPFDV